MFSAGSYPLQNRLPHWLDHLHNNGLAITPLGFLWNWCGRKLLSQEADVGSGPREGPEPKAGPVVAADQGDGPCPCSPELWGQLTPSPARSLLAGPRLSPTSATCSKRPLPDTQHSRHLSLPLAMCHISSLPPWPGSQQSSCW